MAGVHCEKRLLRFTLIELLVVVAIIAILAALLMPALSSARDTAKSALCQGNLKQIATSLGMYMTDYQGFVPPVHTASAPPPPGFSYGSWREVTMAYLRNGKSMVCPSDQDLANYISVTSSSATMLKYGQIASYAENYFFTIWKGTGVYPGSYKESSIKSPSTKVICADNSSRTEMAVIPVPSIYPSSVPSYCGAGCMINLRHRNNPNVIYLDTHVAQPQKPLWMSWYNYYVSNGNAAPEDWSPTK